MAKQKSRSGRLDARIKKGSDDKPLLPDQQQTGPKRSGTGKTGRPAKEPREKFTTALKPENKKRLKIEAINQGMTPADLLNKILDDYFKML